MTESSVDSACACRDFLLADIWLLYNKHRLPFYFAQCSSNSFLINICIFTLAATRLSRMRHLLTYSTERFRMNICTYTLVAISSCVSPLCCSCDVISSARVALSEVWIRTLEQDARQDPAHRCHPAVCGVTQGSILWRPSLDISEQAQENTLHFCLKLNVSYNGKQKTSVSNWKTNSVTHALSTWTISENG